MSKESELIAEIVEYSKKTEEFDINVSEDFILLNTKESKWVPLLWLLLILFIPILSIFTDWTIVFKMIISAIWIIFFVFKYYKTSKENRNLIINKKCRSITLTDNNIITKIFANNLELSFEDIVSIKVERIISHTDNLGKSLVFHAVNIETVKRDETLCLFNDNLIARRFAFLMRIITEK